MKGTLTLKLNEEESEETPTTSSSETSNSHTRVKERNPETFQHVMEWCAINMMNSSCEKDKNGRCKCQKLHSWWSKLCYLSCFSTFTFHFVKETEKSETEKSERKINY